MFLTCSLAAPSLYGLVVWYHTMVECTHSNGSISEVGWSGERVKNYLPVLAIDYTLLHRFIINYQCTELNANYCLTRKCY